jgi:ribosomal protein S18 acetylase RimI-like enzyme
MSDNNNYLYRAGEVSDAESVVLLMDQAQAKRKDEPIPKDILSSEDVLICQQTLADPESWSLLVFDHELLAASVIITLGEYNRPQTILAGRMLIDLLMVDPEHWSQGLGSELLDQVDKAFEKKLERIGLWTEADNKRARALYERKSYYLTGEQMTHPRSGERQLGYEKKFI